MALLDLLTGGKAQEADSDLNSALGAINAVATPTTEEMQFQIQQLVQAGVMTPEEAQTFLQSPSAFSTENIDQTGTQAQQQAIASLLGAAGAGGLNPEEQAQMQQIEQQLATQEHGANQAAIQGQAARGNLTGGETLAAQLEGNQAADVNANQLGAATAGNAYQQMINELTSAGSLGSGLQGQENTQANTVASAIDAINRFNTTQQQTEENLNTQASNVAQEENLANLQDISNKNVSNANAHALQQSQLPQETYQDALAKAEAAAGIDTQMANQATGQGEQNAGIVGGLTGLGATTVFGGNNFGSPSSSSGGSSPAGAAGAANTFSDFGAGAGEAGGSADAAGIALVNKGGEIKDFRSGGPVPGKAVVPGNSPRNDNVPAMLSPGEVVLPRTVTKNPSQDKVMSFLNRMRAPKQIPPAHPHDIKSVLDALSMRRGMQP